MQNSFISSFFRRNVWEGLIYNWKTGADCNQFHQEALKAFIKQHTKKLLCLPWMWIVSYHKENQIWKEIKVVFIIVETNDAQNHPVYRLRNRLLIQTACCQGERAIENKECRNDRREGFLFSVSCWGGQNWNHWCFPILKATIWLIHLSVKYPNECSNRNIRTSSSPTYWSRE